MAAEIFILLLNGLHVRLFVHCSCRDCYFHTRNGHTVWQIFLLSFILFLLCTKVHVSNTMFLGCVEESCDISLESNVPASAIGGDFDYFWLLRDHDTSYKKASFVIKIPLATQKSIKPPYLVSLNVSQTGFNGAAIFSQTHFRLHPLCLT